MGELIGLAKEIGLPGYMLLLACAIGYMMYTLQDIRKGMRWIDTCEEKHKNVDSQIRNLDERLSGDIGELDCRIEHLETKVFDL